MDYGREHLAEVVESALGRFRFDRDSLTRYFALLRYGFTAEYQQGLRRFYELAYEAGELARGAGAALHRRVARSPRGRDGRRPGGGRRAPAPPPQAPARRCAS